DAKPAVLLFNCDIGFGLDPLGSDACLLELKRERHGKAPCMRRADKLLRVGAFFPFKACFERIRRLGQNTAIGADRALAIPKVAGPDGTCGALHDPVPPSSLRMED